MRARKTRSLLLSAAILLTSASLMVNPLYAASYQHSQTPNLELKEQNLSGVLFDWANLPNANFQGANLTRTSFTHATLSNCNLQNADLREANFERANLVNCDLRGAQVAGANFEGANFHGSRLAGVDFTQANIKWSEMRGADFRATPAGLTAQDIINALTDKATGKMNLEINFDYNKATLRPEADPLLTELATALNSPELASLKILIEGHTDNVGGHSFNMNLSKRRANSVKTALVKKHGVKASQLSVKGFGKTRPIESNNTEEGRAKNRRVTVVNLSVAK